MFKAAIVGASGGEQQRAKDVYNYWSTPTQCSCSSDSTSSNVSVGGVQHAGVQSKPRPATVRVKHQKQ